WCERYAGRIYEREYRRRCNDRKRCRICVDACHKVKLSYWNPLRVVLLVHCRQSRLLQSNNQTSHKPSLVRSSYLVLAAAPARWLTPLSGIEADFAGRRLSITSSIKSDIC